MMMPADCDLTRILEQARTAVDDCPEALAHQPPCASHRAASWAHRARAARLAGNYRVGARSRPVALGAARTIVLACAIHVFEGHVCNSHVVPPPVAAPHASSLALLYASNVLCPGFVLTLEIELDLDVVGIAQKYLPTGAIWHLVHVVLDSLLGQVPLRCLEAAAAESDMIDDAFQIGTLCCLSVCEMSLR